MEGSKGRSKHETGGEQYIGSTPLCDKSPRSHSSTQLHTAQQSSRIFVKPWALELTTESS